MLFYLVDEITVFRESSYKSVCVYYLTVCRDNVCV